MKEDIESKKRLERVDKLIKEAEKLQQGYAALKDAYIRLNEWHSAAHKEEKL